MGGAFMAQMDGAVIVFGRYAHKNTGHKGSTIFGAGHLQPMVDLGEENSN